ncbi:hypothetical protein BGZ93_003608 [Podila epicladia]|nr:hypothetical protein BGZ92_009401 [Podila epicladia]KAG0100791.1 hypothetical protein BGZ93_003608 [Podila epicladia]
MDGLQPQIRFSGQGVFSNQNTPSKRAKQASDAPELQKNYSPQKNPPSHSSDSETGSSGNDDEYGNDAKDGEHLNTIDVSKDNRKEDSSGRMSVDDGYEDENPSKALTGRHLLSTASSSSSDINLNPIFTATLSSSGSSPTSMLTATLDFTAQGLSLPPPSPMSTYGGSKTTSIEFDDKIRKYLPEQFETIKAYDVGGINILNKKTVDSQTALDKIKRRRETHNRVERRRRDQINQLIDELTTLLPKDDEEDQSRSHRVNILRSAVSHIQQLTRQNQDLQNQIHAIQSASPSSSSSSTARTAMPAPPLVNSAYSQRPLSINTWEYTPTDMPPEGSSRRLHRQSLPRLEVVPPPHPQYSHQPQPPDYYQHHPHRYRSASSPGSSYSSPPSTTVWSVSPLSPADSFSASGRHSPSGASSYREPHSPYSPYGPPSSQSHQAPRSPGY